MENMLKIRSMPIILYALAFLYMSCVIYTVSMISKITITKSYTSQEPISSGGLKYENGQLSVVEKEKLQEKTIYLDHIKKSR